MTLCTEAEAKTKRCPFARATRCIASACMAWRWYDREYEFHETIAKGPALTPLKPPEGSGWEMAGPPPMGAGNLMRYRRAMGERRRGFCGPAGPIVAGPSVPAMTVAR